LPVQLSRSWSSKKGLAVHYNSIGFRYIILVGWTCSQNKPRRCHRLPIVLGQQQ
jgi:hypothetical protein